MHPMAGCHCPPSSHATLISSVANISLSSARDGCHGQPFADVGLTSSAPTNITLSIDMASCH
eukprot:6797102-Pyramimonas_sp.AAC.1